MYRNNYFWLVIFALISCSPEHDIGHGFYVQCSKTNESCVLIRKTGAERVLVIDNDLVNVKKVAKKNKLYAVQSVALSYDCALESGDSLIITRHTGELIFFSVDILESNSHAMRLSKSEIISEMGEDFYLSLNEKKYYYASSDEIYFNKQSSQCKSLVKI